MLVSILLQYKLLVGLTLTVLAESAPLNSSCRAIPGDYNWPSTQQWDQLNRTVSGRLIATIPLASVCHRQPFHNYNQEACQTIKSAWLNDTTFLNNPAEIMNPVTQNYSCVPFTAPSRACVLGSYASYSIHVATPGHIAAGIQFAREHNLRLVIKNTGHDFAGKSTGKGALSLWTRDLNTTDIIPSYKSSGYSGPAVKLGAGVVGGFVYEALGAAGYRMLGGTCPTVGLAGGYTLGGGHSLLNGAYGMAADAVLEWEVITPDGQQLVATPYQNTDLYWALSGGGGSTFAIVVSMTAKIFKDGPIGSGILSFNMTNQYWDAIGDLLSYLPQFVDDGPNTWDFALTPTGFQAFAITVPNQNSTYVKALLKPFLDKLTGHGIKYSYQPTDSATYLEYFSSRFGPGIDGAGPSTEQLASRLLPRAAVSRPHQNKEILKAMQNIVKHQDLSIGCHALNVGNIKHPDNSVLPAWRTAIATCNIVSYWNYNVTQAQNQARQDLLVNDLIPGLEKATPGSGTYLNEINAQWKGDWRKELYGANYPRLLQIKNKYDPEHVLYAPTAVGSDSWTTDSSGRICRV